MDDYQTLFPSLAGPPYLNHAAIAPVPIPVADAVRRVIQEQLNAGGHQYESWLDNESRLRSNLASLVQAGSSADIALLPNTASGISTLAEGIDWEPGDEIVLPEEEFPSNRLPWLAQASRGLKIVEVPWQAVTHQDDAPDPEATLMAACNQNTRLLAISAVAWHNGFRFDLQRLGEFCNDNDIIFCVDAIQQLGALPIDVQACHIDCLAAGSHKWLLCPEGLAAFYTSAALRQQLRPSRHGWRMTDEPFNFSKSEWTISSSGRKFEPGTGNNLGIAAMAAATDLFLEIGMIDVGEQVLKNRNRLAEGLSEIEGITLLSNQQERRRSGILVFSHPQQRFIGQSLEKAGISFALRGGGIRFSPHFYQPEEVMDRALETVRSALT